MNIQSFQFHSKNDFYFLNQIYLIWKVLFFVNKNRIIGMHLCELFYLTKNSQNKKMTSKY